MRWRWALALLVLFPLFLGSARADPALSIPRPGEGLAQWTLSNPANYTLQGVDLTSSGARLAWTAGTLGDTKRSDFESALVSTNIDLTAHPGDVAILNTSQLGPLQSLTFQPDPAPMADTYLYEGNGGNRNFGTSPELRVGNWGGNEWNRGLLRFPAFPLLSNATLQSVRLELFLWIADTPGPMDVSVHRVPTSWTELGSDWNTADGTAPWNATGGDFDPVAVDTVAGITTTTGWYTWNITSLAQGWWRGTIPNQGLMVRQADDTLSNAGRKQFSSSDATNVSARPRLLIGYMTPRSTGVLESRILDAVSTARWGPIWWNATTPPGTTVALQTRTGESAIVDSTWSAWSSPYPAPGAAVVSPAGRRLQYRATLSTPNSTSPLLEDVAVDFGRYLTPGTLVTEPLAPWNVTAWRRLEVNWSGDPTTSVAAEYSQDGGLSWVPIASGENVTSALPGSIILRLTLGTVDTTRTPILLSFSLGFATHDRVATISPLDLWPLVIPAVIGLAWVAFRMLSKGRYRLTDLFLIHADGRLIMRVGGEENPMEDELASSGMFTLVIRFVRDSFGGSGPGELKSMTVDEREVVIGKGEFLFLALVLEGAKPPELDDRVAGFLGSLERENDALLREWNGLDTKLGPLRERLGWFLQKGYRKNSPHAAEDSRA